MEWISVKERLPEYGEQVLLQIKTWRVYWCDIKSIAIGSRLSTNSSGENWSMYGSSCSDRSSVTHWMPLPKLPENLN
jgi:hypothetical protein